MDEILGELFPQEIHERELPHDANASWRYLPKGGSLATTPFKVIGLLCWNDVLIPVVKIERGGFRVFLLPKYYSIRRDSKGNVIDIS